MKFSDFALVTLVADELSNVFMMKMVNIQINTSSSSPDDATNIAMKKGNVCGGEILQAFRPV